MDKILVIGVTGAGRESLSAAQLARVLQAELLVGGDRQLSYFPECAGERLSLRQGIVVATRRLREALDAGQRAVVLASGDPLCYGVGSSLRRSFAAEELEIVPAPTSYQLAFAALGEPWHDATLLSAHGRPLAEVVRMVCAATKVAILTDDLHTPALIAQALLDAGMPADRPCAICENLGEPEQRIVRTSLADAAKQTFAALNVLVVWSERVPQGDGHPVALSPCEPVTLSPIQPGIPDANFSTTGHLLTRREIRLLSLAELAPQPGEVFWDLGAGSGAVSIEAARWQPAATVYAIERRSLMCEHIRENMRRFPAPNMHLVQGVAPAACADLPDPHAVFIGGSGGTLAELIALVQRRLHPGGRLALALVTLESLQIARDCLPDARVAQVQVSVGTPILGMLRLEAYNPVFLLTWQAKFEIGQGDE
ncbi:precorrin-6y C5,15-methyltransferase (decarboxylating) subunit CbiE [Chloroflexales bacterium ZM16-3]|nr:precorrin-6y C5,15-methyltransferase (decarboxylating) subunit CbiE [Chloroflexales bacterium ZM16-3]